MQILYIFAAKETHFTHFLTSKVSVMKKNFTLFVAFFACCCMSLQAQAQHNYGANGVCTDPDCEDPFQPAEKVDSVYQLKNAGNIEWMSAQIAISGSKDADGVAYLNARYEMMNDIDFTGVSHSPIGPTTGQKFDGFFDGKFHRITNMVIDVETDNVGFFGCVRGTATIQNLTLDKSCSISGGNRTGGLIGAIQTYGNGVLSILNCVNEATVTSKTGAAGAIIGAGMDQYPYFEMHNCVNLGDVTAAETNYATVFNTWNKGNQGGSPAKSSQVWSCYNMGHVSPIDNMQQMFRGNYRSINNTFDFVYPVSEGYQGPAAAWTTADPVASGELCYVLNQYATRGISFKQQIGIDPYPLPMPEGYEVFRVGRQHCDGTPYDDVAYSNSSAAVVQDDHNYVNGLCSYCGKADLDYLKPDADSIYHFSTPEHIEWFSTMVNKEWIGNMKCVLDADIDFGGVENAHTPIGTDGHKFFGQFDGQGHHIKGMVIMLGNVGSNGAGFFGSLRGGGTAPDGTLVNDTVIVRNLFIDSDCSVSIESGNAAGLVGRINSRNSNANIIMIENCGNEADVTSTNSGGAAGIVGTVVSTQVGLIIRNCYNMGLISGTMESAAICAWTGTAAEGLTKEFSNCWNTGEVWGMDNDRNLFRIPASGGEIFNCYDLNEYNLMIGSQGKREWLSGDPVRSGELAYAINKVAKKPVWFQTLDTDEHPVTDSTHGYVYGMGDEFADVHDEASFLDFRTNSVDYECVTLEDILATDSLLTKYAEDLVKLKVATSLTEFLSMYDALEPQREAIEISQQAYEDYKAMVEQIRKQLEENDGLNGKDKDKLDDYLNNADEPDDEYPNGTYGYIIDTHYLSTEDIAAETEYVQQLYDLALRNSISSGADLTNLIINPTFANGVEGWTVTGGVTTGGVVEVMPTAQAWNTTFDIHQTITGLQNGMYELVANGVFRSEPRDENHSYVGYMYANDARVYLPTIFEDYISISEAKDSVNCYITPEASTLDIEIYEDNALVGYAPQGLVGSSFHFKDGRYVNHLLVEVTDGTLTIGMANPGTGNANDWTGFSNFRLFYQGKGEEAVSAADRTLAGMAARAETLGEYFGDISDYNAFPNFSTSLREGLEDAKAQIETLCSIEDRMALIGRFSDIFAEIYTSRMAYRNYMNEVNYFLDKSGDFFLDGVIDDDTYTAIYDLTDEIIANLDLGMYSTEEALAQEALKTSPSYVLVFGEEPEQDEDGWYLIKNALNVEWFSQMVNRGNTLLKGKLMNDIDMTGISHTPIGLSSAIKFNGQFDGQFHRILNMVIETTRDNQAFFGWVRGGGTVIKNLIIDKSCSVTAGDCSAGVIAKTQTYASAPLYVLNCVNEANITGGGATTGIIGAGTSQYTHTRMHNCVNTGKIFCTQEQGTNKYASGFIGWHGEGNGGNSQMWNCLNIGEISPMDGNNQLFRGSYRNMENTFDMVNTESNFQGVHMTFTTEDPVASGELCWLLNQHATEGVSYKQTIGVDPYPLPVEDGKHLPVLKDDEGNYYNEGGDGIVIVHNSQSTVHSEMYDLSGRRVEKATKGIYLQNGKKVLVK